MGATLHDTHKCSKAFKYVVAYYKTHIITESSLYSDFSGISGIVAFKYSNWALRKTMNI